MTYNGPSVGFTHEELAIALGEVIIDFMDKSDLEIVWKKRD